MATKPVGDRNAQDKGMVDRLKDQLKTQKKVAEIHANVRQLTEYAFYPKHDARRETKEYKAVHNKLVKEMDRPCLICGVKNSTLKDKKINTFGAKQMETHHHVVEWALANAIDIDKFNSTLLPFLKRKHPNKPEYKKTFTEEDVRNWVDHSEDNLWVLCDVHHRAQYLGVHEITYPIWGPQDLLRGDFEEYVKSEIAKVKGASKGGNSKGMKSMKKS